MGVWPLSVDYPNYWDILVEKLYEGAAGIVKAMVPKTKSKNSI